MLDLRKSDGHDHDHGHEHESGGIGGLTAAALLRILELFAAFGVIGWVVMRVFVFRQGPGAFKLMAAAAALFAAAGALRVGGLAHTLGGEEALQAALVLLSGHAAGITAWLRPLLALAAGALLLVPRHWARAAAVAASLGLAATFAWTGHAAAAHSGAAVAAIAHTLHVFSGAVWFTGLALLAFESFRLERSAQALLQFHRYLRTYSQLAFGLMVVVVLSGVLLTLQHVDGWDRFFASGYGQLLIFKVGVLLCAVPLALMHRYELLPKLRRLEQEGETAAAGSANRIRALLWSLRAEVLLAFVIVIAAGMLSTTSPPHDHDHSHHDEAPLTGALNISAEVEPATVKAGQPALLKAKVSGGSGGIARAEVSFELVRAGTDTGVFAAGKPATEAGRYEAAWKPDAAGTYKLTVHVTVGAYHQMISQSVVVEP